MYVIKEMVEFLPRRSICDKPRILCLHLEWKEPLYNKTYRHLGNVLSYYKQNPQQQKK